MDFDEFGIKFLAGLYWETEHNNGQFVRVSRLIEKYGLQPKPNWISRMAEEWEHFYFKDISKTISGYDSWSFRISADGYRKIEEIFADDAEVADFLGLPKDGGEYAPAANRIVKISDNSDAFASAAAALASLSSNLAAANDFGNLTEDEIAEARREVWILEQAVQQEAVRIDWIEPVAKACLQWIATKAAEQIVGTLAVAALAALAALFGFAN